MAELRTSWPWPGLARCRTIRARMKIYTKTGDTGETGLFGGGRVSKSDPRVDAYGEIDELNAFVGFARSQGEDREMDELLDGIQRDLFAIGALLATPDREKMRRQLAKASIDAERVAELERAIDRADTKLAPLRSFILPAGTGQATALHVARTVCRRAERKVVALAPAADIPELVIVYLNRLSDLLFTLARFANIRAGSPEVEW
jgi:cob(I)alamin adenosyltransferase